MHKTIEIKAETKIAAVDLALDTIMRGKQALVFLNTRRSAEKTAEDIANKLKKDEKFNEIADIILSALSKPTKQCEKLAGCIKKGIAFHHAGLLSKQREIIEDNFKSGAIKIICSTPTLAMGLDLPASRVIIRDLKRYGIRGLVGIPVLEYLQMCGRSGRPKFDPYGEAIAIAGSKNEKESIKENYINGLPEDIYSKLALEPALRMYILSLAATGIISDKKQLMDFFNRTFWAYQIKDSEKIKATISKVLNMLKDWGFLELKGDDFISADEIENNSITATIIGKRVSELYIDPLTASFFMSCLKKADEKKAVDFSFLQMVSHTLELRPLLRVKSKEIPKIEQSLVKYQDILLEEEPAFGEDYESFANSIKTALMFFNWINEKDEEFLFEEFDIKPGELMAKIEIADWLLYTSEELCKLMQIKGLLKEIIKLRLRVKNGIKEELLPLIRLRGIGRVRARRLFFNQIETIADIKSADLMKLTQILGKETALSVKKQVDQNFEGEVVKEGKRKGQISLRDY